MADANAARPVTAGGTGSGTAIGGFDNLSVAGASIASASTVNLANATGSSLTITGTVTITSFGTVPAGAERVLTFAAALTLTYNATSMILPGAANIVTAAGDVATFRSLGSGNWQCVSYQRANGQSVSSTIILKQSAAPTPTAEGDIQWDTDDDVIVIGDGAAQRIFVPLPASTAAGDVLYMTSAKALARLGKGTASQVLQMNAGATAPQWATLPFTKSFESAQQTITGGGLLTLAHGLGVQPKLYQAFLVCVTAELGFSVGQEFAINPELSASGGSFGRGLNMTPDSTNIVVQIGSDGIFNIVAKSSGGTFAATTAGRWGLIVRAWA